MDDKKIVAEEAPNLGGRPSGPETPIALYMRGQRQAARIASRLRRNIDAQIDIIEDIINRKDWTDTAKLDILEKIQNMELEILTRMDNAVVNYGKELRQKQPSHVTESKQQTDTATVIAELTKGQ